jgi:hypothetical protein
MIVHMHSYLCTELNIRDKQQQTDQLCTLCATQVQILGYRIVSEALWEGSAYSGYHGYRPFPRELSLAWKVTAAISVRVYNLLRELLPQLDLRKFDFVELSPIIAAAHFEDDELLKTTLEHVVPANGQLVEHMVLRRLDWHVEHAVELTIRQASTGRTTMLLQWAKTSKIRRLGGLYIHALKTAVRTKTPVLDLVRAILSECPKGNIHADVFIPACKSKNVEVVKLLLGHMNIDQGKFLTLPLNMAIRHGNSAVIEAVIDAGAKINILLKKERWTGTSEFLYPLEFAMSQTVEKVAVLIRRGAVVPAWWMWKGSPKRLYEVLRDGRIEQTGEEVPVFDKMTYAIFRADFQAYLRKSKYVRPDLPLKSESS